MLAILNHTSTSVETGPHKPREQPVAPPMEAASGGPDKRWGKRDTVLVLLVLLLAGGLRVLRLAEPDAVVFDETYYAKDACLYLGHSQQFCGLDQATEQSYVHPPLGKWFISLGIKAFGYNSFGWRFSAAIFGTAMAGLVYALARKLFADRWIAAVAGLLTATDFLLIVQSRIAMLDIFLSFFVVLGFFCLVMDRERAIRLKDRLGPAAPGPPPGAATSPSQPQKRADSGSPIAAAPASSSSRLTAVFKRKRGPREPRDGHSPVLSRNPEEGGRGEPEPDLPQGPGPEGRGPGAVPEHQGSAAGRRGEGSLAGHDSASSAGLEDKGSPADRHGERSVAGQDKGSAKPGPQGKASSAGQEKGPPAGARDKQPSAGRGPSLASEADRDSEADPPGRGVGWRIAAGAAFGLAISVKWSALLALGAAAVCALFWSLELLILARKQRSAFYGPPRAASLIRELAIGFAAFFLVPLLVYSATYSAYFLDRLGEECPFTIPGDPNRLFDAGLLRDLEGRCVTGVAGAALSFGDLQDRMLDYHANLKAEHSYQSKAWTWPLVLRPVAYFYETEDATAGGDSGPLPLLLRPLDFLVGADDGTATEVIALGNVVTWYGALLALAWLIPRSLQSWRPERVVLLAWGAQYLPWLLVPRPLFFFYMTPVVPFMMIGLAVAARALWQRWAAGKTAVGIYLVSAAVVLLLFYPVIAAVPLPEDWWRRLMWIPHFKCGGLQCGWI